METVTRLFIDYSISQLRKNVERIEKCMSHLTMEQVWMRRHESGNAPGNLILHLAGNVRQWIIAGVGGTPDTRDRDSEFNARDGVSKDELIERLRSTVEAACGVIGALSSERLESALRVQNRDLSVLEGIYHVVEHFGQHTGQIMFVTKLLTGEELGFTTHVKSVAK